MRYLDTLAHGLDTLHIWLSWAAAYMLPKALVQHLDAALKQYRAADSEGFLFGVERWIPLVNSLNEVSNGQPMMFQAAQVKGVRHYAWALVFPGIVVKLSRPKDSIALPGYPQVFIEISGRYLQFANRDHESVVTMLVAALSNLIGSEPVTCNVSRADLFADFLTDEPFADGDKSRFVSRAKERCSYSHDTSGAAPWAQAAPVLTVGVTSNTPLAMHESQSFQFGNSWSGFRFGSGALLARIYSKTIQAAKRDPSAMDLLESYGNPDGHVIRVEYQMRSEALASLSPESVDLRRYAHFNEAIGVLWAYLTTSWLTLREDSDTEAIRNREIDQFWTYVVAAFGPNSHNIRRNKLLGSASSDMLIDQALGCLMSACAVSGLPMSRLWELRHHVKQLLDSLMPRKQPKLLHKTEFERRYAARLAEYAGVAHG